MQVIKDLSEKISEEIQDATSYAKMALELRTSYPDAAKTLYSISLEEMEHMKRIHDAVAEIIEDYRKEKGPPPAGMAAVYDYLHKQQIEKAAEARTLQGMYKEA